MFIATRSEKEAREVRGLAEAMFREEQSYLFRLARSHARNEEDAQDALSEAFVAFLRAYDPHGGAPPLAWLSLTLKRECWRRRRDAHLDRHVGQEAGRGDEEQGSILDLLPAPGPLLEARIAERDDARRRLAVLKPNERTGLGLFAAGYSYKEIATQLRWTFTKVSRCIREGRAALATA